jgi:type I restriction enzyme S subunit
MVVKIGYKQTEVGVIPIDWNVFYLGKNATFRTGPFGSLLHKSDYIEGGIPVINPMQIIDGKIVPTHNMTVPAKVARRMASFKLSRDDVIIGRRGEMGRCAFVSEVEAGMLCGTGSMVITCLEKLNGRFLQRILSSPQFVKAIENASVGTTMVNLNNRTLANLAIPVPTITEQEVIAGALSDADAWIESLEQLIAKKRQIKQGAMQELLTGKRRLPGFRGEWSTMLLGELITHCSSGATPYRGRGDYYQGSVRWITSGELNYNIITDTIEHISQEAVANTNLKLHPPGTFLMAITGLEAAGTRGSCGIVGAAATTNQSCMAVYPNSRLTPKYLFHYYVYRGDELALKYCQGTKQQSYTAGLVRLLPIELPPTTDEQNAITEVLSSMDAEIELIECKLAKARQIKQGMMQELLTGRIRLV